MVKGTKAILGGVAVAAVWHLRQPAFLSYIVVPKTPPAPPNIQVSVQLRCAPHRGLGAAKKCGFTQCDFKRKTFETQCVQRYNSFLPMSSCIYVGKHGQLHPLDKNGRPAPYS